MGIRLQLYFSNTFPSYTPTTAANAVDYVDFTYNSGTSKFEITQINYGNQSSPSASTFSDIARLFGDGSDGAVTLDGTVNRRLGIQNKLGLYDDARHLLHYARHQYRRGA